MSDINTNEPMLDMYLFETTQLIEQLEQIILESEKENFFSETAVNEIFRIMHTVKGSSAMMMFNGIASLAHTMEDLFYFLREDKPKSVDYSSVSDLVLEGIDFIKIETEKIKDGDNADGSAEDLIERLKDYLSALKRENHSDNKEQQEKPDEKQRYYIYRIKPWLLFIKMHIRR
jgi:two-component system chemotaxis sensor kinase CheA